MQTQCHSCVMPVQLFLSSYFPLCDFLRTSLLVADQDLRSLCGVLLQFPHHGLVFCFDKPARPLAVEFCPGARQATLTFKRSRRPIPILHHEIKAGFSLEKLLDISLMLTHRRS